MIVFSCREKLRLRIIRKREETIGMRRYTNYPNASVFLLFIYFLTYAYIKTKKGYVMGQNLDVEGFEGLLDFKNLQKGFHFEVA